MRLTLCHLAIRNAERTSSPNTLDNQALPSPNRHDLVFDFILPMTFLTVLKMGTGRLHTTRLEVLAVR